MEATLELEAVKDRAKGVAEAMPETSREARTAGLPAERPDPAPAPADRPERPQTLIQAIYQAATNPAIDIAKVERLIELQRSVEADQARRDYYDALPGMQAELPVVGRKGTITGVSAKTGKSIGTQHYARWEDIYEKVQPILASHGFSLTFRNTIDAGNLAVTAILTHRAGHSEQTTVTVGPDKTGSKNEAQAIGSSLSYGRRYAASLLLNLTSRGEDDDGEAAGTITAKQYHELEKEMERAGFTAERVCNYVGQLIGRDIDALADIPASVFDRTIMKIRRLVDKGSQKPTDDPKAGE